MIGSLPIRAFWPPLQMQHARLHAISKVWPWVSNAAQQARPDKSGRGAGVSLSLPPPSHIPPEFAVPTGWYCDGHGAPYSRQRQRLGTGYGESNSPFYLGERSKLMRCDGAAPTGRCGRGAFGMFSRHAIPARERADVPCLQRWAVSASKRRGASVPWPCYLPS